jgi:hypothetical protein
VLKAKWKGLSGRASGGLKIGAHKWCMDGGDLMMGIALFLIFLLCLISCVCT